MKYNVGDRVRIKNFDWFRNEGTNMVVAYMTKYYGEVVTIKSVHKGFYRIKEDGGQYCWIDEMFECKMEEETKPELKYKVGDKVLIKSLDWYNENKDADSCVHCGDRVFDNYMSVFCGSVVTIGEVGLYGYGIREDMHCRTWTDEMFECKAEDECPQDFIEKYCKSCGTQRCDRTEEYLNGCPYYNAYMCKKQNNAMEEETKPKYEDEVNGEYYSTPKYLVRPSGYQFVDENGNVINAQKIVLEKLVIPKFKKGDKIKDKNNRVWYVVQVGDKHFDISRIPNCSCNGSGYFVPMEDQDDYELAPDRELPKTFEECVSVLMREGGNRMSLELMNTFRKLIDARNAYWKIAGEEMGLGKPWEPNWETLDTKYDIYNYRGVISHNNFTVVDRCVLVFPTAEMRDAFYENFKSEIEICKEFL